MNLKTYTIENEHIRATFLNVGAVMTELYIKSLGLNVLVGHQKIEEYVENPGYMNAVIGRHAGRATDFDLNGERVTLKNNEGTFQLHGGKNGFHSKWYEVEDQDDRIIFRTEIPHLEDGYPGNLQFEIEYRLVGPELHLFYRGTTDRTTVLSCTHHAYFNLNGDVKEPITNHELWINADEIISLDERMVPAGRMSIVDTPLDFRRSKAIGRDLETGFDLVASVGGYDHPYLLTRKSNDLEHVATLSSPLSQLAMDIFTDQRVLVLYTSNAVDETFTLNEGIKGYVHCAVCLEAEGVPNAQNIEDFRDLNIISPDHPYEQHTCWKFYSRENSLKQDAK